MRTSIKNIRKFLTTRSVISVSDHPFCNGLNYELAEVAFKQIAKRNVNNKIGM